MAWFLITHIFSTLLELVGTGRLSERQKDLEILILRHQLDILERKQKTPVKPNHGYPRPRFEMCSTVMVLYPHPIVAVLLAGVI